MDWEKVCTASDVIIESPGRINLIGEHLDYNGGLVLPAAINLKVRIYFKKNHSNQCNIYSKSFADTFVLDLDRIEISEKEWHNYFLGVIHFIEQKSPNKISGFDCVVESELPIGSGVSSSAALECGIAKGLDELFKIDLKDIDIITISRDAEHHFVGTKCGIMDQFTVVKGKKDKLIKLDCKDLSFEYVSTNFAPYVLLLLNTNVSHNLASSEYNLRREECELGLKHIQKKYPEYTALAEVPITVIEELKSGLSAKVFDRLTYVVQENKRTVDSCKALENNDLQKFGALLFKSHKGLRCLYEVSCKELDFLVDFSKDYNGVIGARMMGGGFGGCTINLLHKDVVDAFIKNASEAYYNHFNIKLTPFTVAIGDGVNVLT